MKVYLTETLVHIIRECCDEEIHSYIRACREIHGPPQKPQGLTCGELEAKTALPSTGGMRVGSRFHRFTHINYLRTDVMKNNELERTRDALKRVDAAVSKRRDAKPK